jgi:hypothetical protein
MASYMDAVNGKHTDGREQGVGVKRMKRTEIEELLGKMEQFADFLFAQGKAGAGNAVLDAVGSVDAALEDHVLED